MQIQEPSQGNNVKKAHFGIGDASFRAAGGEQGVFQLVHDFYQAMDTLPEAAVIRAMHPADLSMAADKLARFLCGWLGGPRLFSEKYGSINIPQAHSHLAIGSNERDEWLLCMNAALEKQPYSDDFKQYLLLQLGVPAERCRNKD